MGLMIVCGSDLFIVCISTRLRRYRNITADDQRDLISLDEEHLSNNSNSKAFYELSSKKKKKKTIKIR